ncbi:hypothetical protein CVT26_007304 [Gymnopilus dilepis]|uniref:C2H2-type domain-containing protein n=1 Tax=Gymnopilus dilepis TaxID=231916 RepID=A0A409W1J9_9AGAR|nr:hypothetical protein CVT26_007304 [Gymnopilus dilepis]
MTFSNFPYQKLDATYERDHFFLSSGPSVHLEGDNDTMTEPFSAKALLRMEGTSLTPFAWEFSPYLQHGQSEVWKSWSSGFASLNLEPGRVDYVPPQRSSVPKLGLFVGLLDGDSWGDDSDNKKKFRGSDPQSFDLDKDLNSYVNSDIDDPPSPYSELDSCTHSQYSDSGEEPPSSAPCSSDDDDEMDDVATEDDMAKDDVQGDDGDLSNDDGEYLPHRCASSMGPLPPRKVVSKPRKLTRLKRSPKIRGSSSVSVTGRSPPRGRKSRSRSSTPPSDFELQGYQVEEDDPQEGYQVLRNGRGKLLCRCRDVLCQKFTRSRGDMNRHLQSSKHRNPSWYCHITGCAARPFPRDDSLKRHLRLVHFIPDSELESLDFLREPRV